MINEEFQTVSEANICDDTSQQEIQLTSPKAKSKKKVIIISAIIAIVLFGIVAIVIAAVSNSNSLWKEPYEGTRPYGYSVSPEQFIEKANQLELGSENDPIYSNENEFEYQVKFELDDTEKLSTDKSAEQYVYSITSHNDGEYALDWGDCAINYYDDNTIRNIIIEFPYKGIWDVDVAYANTCVSVTQCLYAYGAFDEDLSQSVLNAFIDRQYNFENRRTLICRYNDFFICFYEDEYSESLFAEIEKYDETIFEELEESNYFYDIAMFADLYKQSAEDTNTLTEAAASKLNPEDCIADGKALYERVKPFFEKYGYDIDGWDVTVDDGTVFSAETESEILLIDGNNLAINLNRNGNSNRGLFVISTDDNTNIQLCFSGEDRDKAFELLDIIFENAVVNDEPLSTYIQDEYETKVDMQYETAQWQNGKVSYMIQLKDDYTFLMLTIS